VHDGLLAGRLCAWAQGMELVGVASAAHGWGIDQAELARIWSGGCIIRARVLGPIRAAYRRAPRLENLLLDETLATTISECLPRWRRFAAAAIEAGVPAPATLASLAWYDTLRAAELPTNLVQAQRDAFGAHGFVRRDDPDAGPLHADWTPSAHAPPRT
jgi:6-phosphogluconate dehydrogenase